MLAEVITGRLLFNTVLKIFEAVDFFESVKFSDSNMIKIFGC